MEDYKNKTWFENYLIMLEKTFQLGLKELEKRMMDKFADRDMAVLVARDAMTARLDAMNNFKSIITGQIPLMITRAEYSTNHEILRSEIDKVSKAYERMEGKASQTSFYITAAIAVLSLFLGAIHVFRDFSNLVK